MTFRGSRLRDGVGTGERRIQPLRASLVLLISCVSIATFTASILAAVENVSEQAGTIENRAGVVRNQEAAGSIPARSTTLNAIVRATYKSGAEGDQKSVGRLGDGGPSLERFSGAAVVEVGRCRAIVSALSADDPTRHDPTNYFRNRWSYTLTPIEGEASCISPTAQTLTTVESAVRRSHAAIDIGGVRLFITPGEPELQERLLRNEGACERNDQLVTISVDGAGRTVILIEDPDWLPWTRVRC